jgi:murein DD-endopeptidase MepM/ murein hydrolase activator NlpD
MMSRTLTASMLLVLGLALWTPARATTPIAATRPTVGPVSPEAYDAMLTTTHEVLAWLRPCPPGTSGAQLGGPLPTPLQQLLGRIRQVAPYAQVTSTFDEWRPPSGLRPCGGPHNGYDIGLDAGTPVPAGWSGRVVKIEQWCGAEHCITVQSGEVRVGYGHLLPAVKVGQWVEAGDVVGHVVYNHVDVKMRARHHIIDFSKANPFVDIRDALCYGRPIGDLEAVE